MPRETLAQLVDDSPVELVIDITIPNFARRMHMDGSALSKYAFSPLVPDHRWRLEVAPASHENTVHFRLRRDQIKLGEGETERKVPTNTRIHVLDKAGERIEIAEDATLYYDNEHTLRSGDMTYAGVQDLVLHDDGSLHVVAEVDFFAPERHDKKAEQKVEKSEDDDVAVSKALVESLADMAMSGGPYADFAIHTSDGEKLAVHKCILAQRSSVFREMLSITDSEREAENFVRIDDFSSTAVKTMLVFVYSGSMDGRGGLWEELLAIADKFALEDMKSAAEKRLAHVLDKFYSASIAPEHPNRCHAAATVAIFVGYLLLADKYSAEGLKKACARFLSSNFATITGSDEWHELKSTRKALTIELLEAAMRAKRPAGPVLPAGLVLPDMP